MEIPITFLDGILIAIVLISAGLSMARGFIREVLSILSWVVAGLATFFLYDDLLPYIFSSIQNEFIATGISITIIFLVTLFVVSYITHKISDFLLDSRVGTLDRSAGFIFGAARGFLLMVAAMLLFNLFVVGPQQPAWISNAKSKPILDSVGGSIKKLMPGNQDELESNVEESTELDSLTNENIDNEFDANDS